MIDKRTHFRHFPEQNFSFGYRFMPTNRDDEILVKVSFSKCNPNDEFRRDMARRIIDGRLTANRDNDGVFHMAFARKHPTTHGEYREIEDVLSQFLDNVQPWSKNLQVECIKQTVQDKLDNIIRKYNNET